MNGSAVATELERRVFTDEEREILTNAVLQKTPGGRMPYTHEKMVEVLILTPRITQKELAGIFGFREQYISRILCSDGFREMYERRRKQLNGEHAGVMEELRTRFEALARQSLDRLEEKLEMGNVPAEVALKALEQSSRALGYGAPSVKVDARQQNFIALMPAKAKEAGEWLAEHAPRVVDAQPAGD